MQYKEKQRVNQLWIWGILIFILIVLVFGTYKQVFEGNNFGSKPVSNLTLIIITVFFLLFALFISAIKLITNIDKTGIQIQFIPFFIVKKYEWDQISKVYIKEYSPLRDFGGWGIRYSSQGKAFSLRGRYGLQLELISGDKILIGTQKKEDLQNILQVVSNFKKQ
ncbi:hypothetical protein GNY06_03475 [Elizabethkingia argentiflava]|uniref:Bacterial Pleckstrin homology domain-containing protein n=1 Tax=Elizabethkingia argenteiflava TaxID=2681556 RepID=A0A845PRL1_9FLAO|nr:DUF6141 family protein [Elizabethkingia argenteiflava]NAW50484.1 hypothetical protein [Elizabethkingia argenteiflava]